MPLWNAGERSRGSWSIGARPVPRGHYYLLTQGARVRQSSTYLPTVAAAAPLAPACGTKEEVVPPHQSPCVKEHRVVVAEEHLPLLVELHPVAQRTRVRYAPPPCPSERRAYGGRKDQRNVLRSRFPYRKLIFGLLQRGSIMLRRAPLEGELRYRGPAAAGGPGNSIPWGMWGVS